MKKQIKLPILTFKINKERDILNAWELCNVSLPWAEPTEKKPLEKNYKNLWKDRDFKECREEIWDSMRGLYNSEIVEAFRNSVEKSWKGLNQEYFSRLEKVTSKPIYAPNFTAYITTVGRCPYNIEDNSFMLSIRRPLLQCLRTSGHELMHLQFTHYFWKDIATQIGNTKTSDLNEALTTLLNLEFGDLWLVEDKGYPVHRELRSFIENQWKNNPNFDNLLEKSVDYLKNKLKY